MGTYAALTHTTWVAGYDMTTDLNDLSFKIGYDVLDDSRYGYTARSRVAGFESDESMLLGAWDAGTGTIDTTVMAALTGLKVVTHTVSGTALDVAYFYQARDLEYGLGGKIGQILPFSLSMKSARGSGTLSAGAIRGRLLKAKGSVSATGATGSGYQLGAVSSTQYLYGAVHLFGTAATTITLVLESDDNAGFTSATTRATVGPLTATGGTWVTRVAGAITDDYYRWRITAITGTWTLAAVAGIK